MIIHYTFYVFFTDLYTIEFQKRGLPHAPILIFLHPSSKYPTIEDIDKIISSEIPSPQDQTELYNLVKSHMIHGPCGRINPSSTCMKDEKCTKFYPKPYQESTILDKDGYPIYRRRMNGFTIEKNGILLTNQHVVPHNPMLLLKYHSHINMEWCNKSTSIKYLFKYINKGYDRITASIVPSEHEVHSNGRNLDEIKQYLDCRYVSPSEAIWRILSFPIHARKPVVERLYFHLEGEQTVYFDDTTIIEERLQTTSVTDSMFLSWLEANKIYSDAKNLTYSKFVSKFVYQRRKRSWKPRKTLECCFI